ncbi:alpha/beta hydrolase family protein [Microbacterium jejuense]|uniref:alpha/beta hydrolase family protein n=1 Tax=Microbacterium jejuense TaxID=1263637 RepID=UPI0031F09292
MFRYPVGLAHPAAHEAIGDRIAQLRAGGVARVLLVGFSAGGHAAGLAALAPTRLEARADAVILGYPVVSLKKHSHQGSSSVLLRDGDTVERRSALSLEMLVHDGAPPFFVFHSLDDEKVPVDHSLLLSESLRSHGVPHELHLYPVGGHGCGLGAAGVDWTPACASWLAAGDWIEKTIPVDSDGMVRQSIETGC